MTTRSACLVITPSTLTVAFAVVYTVPANTTTLVKWVQAHNATAAPADVRLAVDVGAGARNLLRQTVPATKSLDLEVWWALEPGWTIQAASPTASAIILGLFGAELEGVAP